MLKVYRFVFLSIDELGWVGIKYESYSFDWRERSGCYLEFSGYVQNFVFYLQLQYHVLNTTTIAEGCE